MDGKEYYIKVKSLKDDISSLTITIGGKQIFNNEAKASVLKIIDEQPLAYVIERADCEKCRHYSKTNSQYPCSHCSNCYTSKFELMEN